MRIGINLTDLIPEKIGGMEYYMRALVEFMPDLSENSIFVFCLKNQSKNIPIGQKVKKIGLNPPESRQKLSECLLQEIKKHKIDVWLSPLLILDPLQADIPKAFTIPDMQHEYYPEFFDEATLKWRRRYYQLSALAADLIITISEDSKKDIVKFLKVPAEKVVVTYLDAAATFYTEHTEARVAEAQKKYALPEKFLFFPANTWPHKNHARLLEAFAIVGQENKDLELILTGHPSNAHDDLKKQINHHPYKNRIRFLGYVEKNDIPLIYKNAAALVFPSLFEGFGIPAVEAMKSQCPMILSNCTSLPEIAGDAALYFDPLNAADLAEKITILLKSPDLQKQLIIKGEKQGQKFSYQKMAQETLNFLQSISKGLLKNDEVQGNKEPLHEAYAAIRRQGREKVDNVAHVFHQSQKPLKNHEIQGNNERPPEPYAAIRQQGREEVDNVARVFKRFLKVSIVTPSYNQGEFIEDTIKSVLNQNYPNLEYIIMDGGSTDKSVEIIKKYASLFPNIIKWYSGKDGGQTDAINKGFAIATGEIVAWLNSDDTYQPGTLKKVVDYFKANPDARFLHGIGHHIEKDGKFIEEYPSEPTDYEKLHYRCQICQPTTFWHRELFNKVGYLNEDLNYCMDYDFWIRIAKIAKLHFLPVHLGNTRFYEDTKTSGQAKQAHAEILKLIRHHYTSVSSSWIYGYAHTAHLKTRKHGNKISESVFRTKLITTSLYNFLKFNGKIPRAELKTMSKWLKDIVIILLRK